MAPHDISVPIVTHGVAPCVFDFSLVDQIRWSCGRVRVEVLLLCTKGEDAAEPACTSDGDHNGVYQI